MRSERRDEAVNVESWSDSELLQQMRRDDASAIREFYRRFTPVLWKEATRARVRPELRDDLVIDCLGDSAIHLMQASVAPPRSLAGYLVTAFRNHVANSYRAASRRTGAGTKAALTIEGESVVRELCSEASLRASAGPAAESPTLSPVLERLSRVVDAGITEQERQMLRWVSASIPQRLIAEWLGLTHNAARVRVLRLRERLIDLALHAETAWTPRERQELYEFFRRAGLSERARQALERQSSGDSERSRRQAGPKLPEDDL
jgi:RNA polymerase sigma factor (sigma-70 family)